MTDFEYALDKNKVCENILENNYTEKQLENVNEDIEVIKQGNYISKIDKYIDEFYTETETILDYIKENCIIFLDENSKIEARAKNIGADYENLIKNLVEKEKVVPEIIQNKNNIEDLNLKLEEKQKIYIENQDLGVSNQNIKFVFKYRY